MTRRILNAAAAAAVILLAAGCGTSRKAIPTNATSGFPAVEQGGKVAIVAHRGFWNCEEAGYSQNSIAALRLAQEQGLWGSEFDVQLTSDDVVIVNHDNSVNGKIIWDTPYEELRGILLKNGEPRPTLEEYLAQGLKSKKTVLVLELKKQKNEAREDVLFEKSIAALKKAKLYDPKRVVFITFSYHLCERVARECPEFVNQYLNGDKSPEELAAAGINGIDYQYALLGARVNYISRCHDLGMSTNVWTVDKDSVMRKMIQHKVDVITTNEPLKLREILGSNEYKK